jgi:lipopolysaccharide export system ATP-binding protein
VDRQFLRFSSNLSAKLRKASEAISGVFEAARARLLGRVSTQFADELREDAWRAEGAENLGAEEPPAEFLHFHGSAQPYARAPTPLRDRAPIPQEGAEFDRQGLLSIHNLAKSYKSRRVVEDVSLHVARGEAVGLLGPNGAGKTTVFYMITGLVKPDKGVIALDGYDVTGLPMYRRARLGIGYLPQEASVFRGLSVEDNIRAVLEITQPDKRRRAEELEALIDEFQLQKQRHTPAIALSGGERRRCEIARALAGHPSFMLLDEPFAGIDPIAVGGIQDLVRHLKARGIGVLITDHSVRETLGLTDRAYIIYNGHVLTEGTPEEIVANPDVRRIYLGEDFRM